MFSEIIKYKLLCNPIIDVWLVEGRLNQSSYAGTNFLHLTFSLLSGSLKSILVVVVWVSHSSREIIYGDGGRGGRWFLQLVEGGCLCSTTLKALNNTTSESVCAAASHCVINVMHVNSCLCSWKSSALQPEDFWWARQGDQSHPCQSVSYLLYVEDSMCQLSSPHSSNVHLTD